MKDQKGFSLIEVVIAVALLGIIAVGFLSALGTASRVLFTVDERETAKNLAESQMEYVKSHSYEDATEYETNPNLTLEGYDVSTSVKPLPDPNNPDNDLVGIQKIIVKIYHHDDAHANPPVLTLEDYKVDR